MVDVFEIAPQSTGPPEPSSHFAYAGQGARLARYQRLVSKLGVSDEILPAGIRVGWLADDDTADTSLTSLKTLHGDDGALVGTFADAAAAAAAAGSSAYSTRRS